MVGLDAHFEQPGNRAVGVAACSVETSRCPETSACTASEAVRAVANFAEHENLRVLSQDARKGAFVRQFAERGDFDLRDAGDFAFDGVLRG